MYICCHVHVLHSEGIPAPTFSEHHSFISREAGGQSLTAQILSALPQILPLQRTLSPQPPEVCPVATHCFMGILDAGHLLCSDWEKLTSTNRSERIVVHPNLHERQICLKNLRKNSFSPFSPTWNIYNESVYRLLIVYLLMYVFIFIININYNVFLIINLFDRLKRSHDSDYYNVASQTE